MTLRIESPLETVFDIEAIRMSRRGRGNRRVAAAGPGPAQKIERRVAGNAMFGEGCLKATDKIRDDRAAGMDDHTACHLVDRLHLDQGGATRRTLAARPRLRRHQLLRGDDATNHDRDRQHQIDYHAQHARTTPRGRSLGGGGRGLLGKILRHCPEPNTGSALGLPEFVVDSGP